MAEAAKEAQAATGAIEVTEFDKLMTGAFKPKTDSAAEAIKQGGAPYGCIVGDYAFDHTPPDVEILSGMAQISAAAHTPFIAGAAPTLLNMDSWQQLADPRDLTKIFQSPEYAPWRSLRESADSQYIGLAMPRYLAR